MNDAQFQCGRSPTGSRFHSDLLQQAHLFSLENFEFGYGFWISKTHHCVWHNFVIAFGVEVKTTSGLAAAMLNLVAAMSKYNKVSNRTLLIASNNGLSTCALCRTGSSAGVY